MSAEQRHTFYQDMRQNPGRWVAEQHIPLSTAPVWDHGHLHSKNIGLRLFAIHNGHEWRVVPGGLTRIATEKDRLRLSLRHGGGSKDTWVIGSKTAPNSPVPDMPQHTALRRSAQNLPSRLADDIFWLGRIVERSEQLARLIRTVEEKGRDSEPGDATLAALIGFLDQQTGLIAPAPAEWDEDQLQRRIIDWQRAQLPGTLRGTLQEIRRVAGRVRSRLSVEVLRILQRIERIEQRLGSARNTAILDDIIVHISAFAGTIAESMVRSSVYTFLDAGRRIERGIICSRLIQCLAANNDVKSDPPLSLLLKAAKAR